MSKPDEIPGACRELLDWYQRECNARAARVSETRAQDPLLELRGSGAVAWADESPDAYVERLRSDRS